jgi:hypothetical protein
MLPVKDVAEGFSVIDFNNHYWLYFVNKASLYSNLALGDPDGEFYIEILVFASNQKVVCVRNNKLELVPYEKWTTAMKEGAIEDCKNITE